MVPKPGWGADHLAIQYHIYKLFSTAIYLSFGSGQNGLFCLEHTSTISATLHSYNLRLWSNYDHGKKKTLSIRKGSCFPELTKGEIYYEQQEQQSAECSPGKKRYGPVQDAGSSGRRCTFYILKFKLHYVSKIKKYLLTTALLPPLHYRSQLNNQ